MLAYSKLPETLSQRFPCRYTKNIYYIVSKFSNHIIGSNNLLSASLPATNILWEPSNNTKVIVKTYHQDNYLLHLTSNQLGQLNKVYDNCISPTQYLPLQFTSINSSTIFSLGRHVSELSSTPPSQSSHTITQYSTSFLHLVYLLLVRPSNCQPPSSSTTSTITNKILSTTY